MYSLDMKRMVIFVIHVSKKLVCTFIGYGNFGINIAEMIVHNKLRKI